jgi:trans-aconitate methyltransferase
VILDELLDEQREFYDRRAPEWPDWIEQYMGPLGPRVQALLQETPELVGSDVLEIAAGTGYHTRWVAAVAGHVWALDASPGMLAEIDRMGLPNVTTMCHDVFDWSPSRRYGAIVAANWLSHVPEELWRAHWLMLEDALAPGGVVIVIDGSLDERPHLGGHPCWRSELDDGHREEVTRRALNDGSQYTVIKRFWDGDELLAQVAGMGWAGEHIQVSTDRGVIFYRLRRAEG